MPNNIFEQIKKVNEYGSEYWSGRELFELLGYTEYGNFIPVIEKAKGSCKNSQQPISDHFAHVSEMIKIATGTEKEALREIDDYRLSRYAYYLIKNHLILIEKSSIGAEWVTLPSERMSTPVFA